MRKFIYILMMGMLLGGCGTEVALAEGAEQAAFSMETIPAEGAEQAAFSTETIPAEGTEQAAFSMETAEEVTQETEAAVPKEYDDFLTITMIGDNLIHTPLYENARQEDGSYDFSGLFEHIKPDIEASDMAIINQETIFVKEEALVSSYPCFGTPDEMGKYLVEAGLDVVAHATNHTYDKKETGVRQTLEYWDTNYPEITYLGIYNNEAEANEIKTYETKGVIFSFVNYTYGLNGFVVPEDKKYLVDVLDNMEKFDRDLQKAEEAGDLTVCILHIGNEYVYEPTQYQREIIARAIDNGADIVFCSHPHVLEPYEMVITESGNSALVYYSLGNFISNQNEIPRLLGGMAQVELKVHYVEQEVMDISIAAFDLVPLVTHYTGDGYYTTYRLDEYTDELADSHKLKQKDSRLSMEYLEELYASIMNTEQ